MSMMGRTAASGRRPNSVPRTAAATFMPVPTSPARMVDDPVDTTEPTLPLTHDPRLERPVPIARHGDLHRAGLGQHRLRTGAVARVPAVPTCRVMLVIAQVSIHLTLQRGLQHDLRQLRQQPTLTADRHPVSLGPSHQLGHHLPIHRRRHHWRPSPRLCLASHRCTILYLGQLHRCSSYTPPASALSMNVDRAGRPAAHALKDAFLTLGVTKDAFSALDVTKDAFSALRRNRPTRRTLMVTALAPQPPRRHVSTGNGRSYGVIRVRTYGGDVECHPRP
jgi:hypothetical protein